MEKAKSRFGEWRARGPADVAAEEDVPPGFLRGDGTGPAGALMPGADGTGIGPPPLPPAYSSAPAAWRMSRQPRKVPKADACEAGDDEAQVLEMGTPAKRDKFKPEADDDSSVAASGYSRRGQRTPMSIAETASRERLRRGTEGILSKSR